MTKWLGYLLILISCWALGNQAVGKLKGRRRALKQLMGWLSCFRGKVIYEGATVEEALRESAGYAGPPFSDFFEWAADELRQRSGRSFGEIWEYGLTQFRGEMPLGEMELADMLRFGSQLGQLDRETQLRAMVRYEEELSAALTRVEAEIGEKEKLYRSLSIMAGCLIIILIW